MSCTPPNGHNMPSWMTCRELSSRGVLPVSSSTPDPRFATPFPPHLTSDASPDLNRVRSSPSPQKDNLHCCSRSFSCRRVPSSSGGRSSESTREEDLSDCHRLSSVPPCPPPGAAIAPPRPSLPLKLATQRFWILKSHKDPLGLVLYALLRMRAKRLP